MGTQLIFCVETNKQCKLMYCKKCNRYKQFNEVTE